MSTLNDADVTEHADLTEDQFDELAKLAKEMLCPFIVKKKCALLLNIPDLSKWTNVRQVALRTTNAYTGASFLAESLCENIQRGLTLN